MDSRVKLKVCTNVGGDPSEELWEVIGFLLFPRLQHLKRRPEETTNVLVLSCGSL